MAGELLVAPLLEFPEYEAESSGNDPSVYVPGSSNAEEGQIGREGWGGGWGLHSCVQSTSTGLKACRAFPSSISGVHEV